MWCWLTSDEASNFATVMTWFTTAGAVGLAWWQFVSWKDQQILLREAEAAGRFYVAVSNFIEVLRSITSPLSIQSAGELDGLPGFEVHLKIAERKRDYTHEYVKAFNDARGEAEVHLDVSITLYEKKPIREVQC